MKITCLLVCEGSFTAANHNQIIITQFYSAELFSNFQLFDPVFCPQRALHPHNDCFQLQESTHLPAQR